MIKNLKLILASFVCTLAFSSSTTNAETVIGTVQVRGHYVWRCTGQCVDQFMTDYAASLDNDFQEMGFWEWAFPEPEPTTIPNMPGNNFKATCGSSTDSRFEHANYDVKTWVGLEMQGQRRGPLSRDEVVVVTYDDGSTEQWKAVGASSLYVLQETPVANSLKCK